jgi:hypothetical protein
MLRVRHILAVLGIFLLAGGAIAQSQQPTPNVGVAGHNPPQAKTGGTQGQAATDQRGTEASPLVVKILNPQNTNGQTAPNQNGHSNEEMNNFLS